METVIGIKFNDFVLIATDMTAAHSIMVMKDGKASHKNSHLFRIFNHFDYVQMKTKRTTSQTT